MTKVFHFDSPRERYECDAAVLWCFDNRFEPAFRKFLKKQGVNSIDPIKVAGGAKCLASPDYEAEREFVLDQIRKSIRLHNTRRVILKVHTDCGAYGGLEKFNNDAASEAVHHANELQRAAATLRAAIPNLQIEGYYVNFEGVWREDLKP